MSNLKVGFARLDVSPMLGIPIRGYYQVRLADGILDPLEINMLSVSCKGNTVILGTLDSCAMQPVEAKLFIQAICDATGLPEENIFRPAAWNAFGMDKEGADYRACQTYGPIYK